MDKGQVAGGAFEGLRPGILVECEDVKEKQEGIG